MLVSFLCDNDSMVSVADEVCVELAGPQHLLLLVD